MYLTSGSGVKWDEERAKNETDTAYQADKGLQNATRVSFLVMNNAAAADAATAQGWTYSEGTSQFILWEPNADQHTTAAIENAAGEKPYDVPHYDRTDLEGATKKYHYHIVVLKQILHRLIMYFSIKQQQLIMLQNLEQ